MTRFMETQVTKRIQWARITENGKTFDIPLTDYSPVTFPNVKVEIVKGYSDGRTVPSVIAVWDDLHNEAAGYFRAFWTSSPDGNTGSPVIGYCSPGGSHRTIGAVVREVKRLYPGEPVYRNGRKVNV